MAMAKHIHPGRGIATLCVLLAVVTVAGSATAATSAPVPGPDAGQVAARVRRNVKDLTGQERREFVEAVLALKSVPSPFDPELSYYDQFVAWHLSLYPCGMGRHGTMRAHGGPMFLPWHRLFVLRFEDALREVTGKPITVPYWDWTDPTSTAAVFADDFMGGDGDPDEGFAVTTGPFRKGAWTLNVHPIGLEWSPSATTYLTRRFGTFPPVPRLPTHDDVVFALDRPSYDVAPYDAGSDQQLSFRNALEGFWRTVGSARLNTGSASMVCGPDGVMMVVSGEGLHNAAHGWVGGLLEAGTGGPRLGTMLLPTSTNDPVFFLHHANIDRLWAEWQDAHGINSYQPRGCGQELPEYGCLGNAGSDRMHPPFDATPNDVADVRALGYLYDTMSPDAPIPTHAGAAASRFWCETGSERHEI
jgi:tyrosinase